MKKGVDTNPTKEFRSPTFLSAQGKILAMGVLLALVLFAFFLPTDRKVKPGETVINRPPAVDLEPFRPDPEILAAIKDESMSDRTYIEHEPWMHLMRMSYNVGPAIAEALLTSDVDMRVATLREQAADHRGKYVRLKGKLIEFREEKRMHPVPRAIAYKGLIETSAGDPVIFFVSKPLADDILEKEDAWVRVEGYFMKIRNEYPFNAPKDILDAPLIIGPRVELAYPDWDAVEKLDLGVVGRVKNAREVDGVWVDSDDMRTMLIDSQEVPLWHMASFALYEKERKAGTRERHKSIYELKEHYEKFKNGEYKQGDRFRLRGQFIGANVLRARTNPIGIEYWTEAWIRIPRLAGGKMFPVWIPGDIGDWEKGEGIDIDGFFFKNYGYSPAEGPDKHTPLFVAASLERFKMESHPATFWVGIGFAFFVFIVAIIFFRMNRQSRKESMEYKDRLVERRRNRRSTQSFQPQ